jgi:hypothetical protein
VRSEGLESWLIINSLSVKYIKNKKFAMLFANNPEFLIF